MSNQNDSAELPQAYLPPASFVPELADAEKRKRVVIVASRCGDPLEMTGPLNVFQIANAVLAISGKPEMGYDLEIVSNAAGTIFEMAGLKITTDRPYSQLRGKVDTLIFTPMDFSDLFSNQEKFLRWVRGRANKVRRLVSICSGVYILAAAGVLGGRTSSAYPAVGPDVNSAGGTWVDVGYDRAYVDGRLVSAAAWPAHPDWLAKFLAVLGTQIEP